MSGPGGNPFKSRHLGSSISVCGDCGSPAQQIDDIPLHPRLATTENRNVSSVHRLPVPRSTSVSNLMARVSTNLDRVINTKFPVSVSASYSVADLGTLQASQQRRHIPKGRVSSWTMLIILSMEHASNPQLVSQIRATCWRFMLGLKGSLIREGLNVDQFRESSEVVLPGGSKGDNRRALESAFARLDLLNLDLLVVRLPGDNADCYSFVKHLCDVKYGIQSHCMLPESDGILAANPYRFAHLAEKTKLKLGGTHSRLGGNLRTLVGLETMILGLDVTHLPEGDQDSAGSISALVSNVNPDCAQWPCSLHQQEGSGQDIVRNLELMALERLDYWTSLHGKKLGPPLPRKIVFYRDSVCESQYRTVLREEISSLRRAFARRYSRGSSSYPSVSVIVVVKRHDQSSLSSLASSSAASLSSTKESSYKQDAKRIGTPLPPSILMTDNPSTIDDGFPSFYIEKKQDDKGVIQSPRYVIFQDEIQLGLEWIKKLTNGLCAISDSSTLLVPPALYAHSACERARCYYLRDDLKEDPDPPGRSPHQGQALGIRHDYASNQWSSGKIHENLQNTMYYI